MSIKNSSDNIEPVTFLLVAQCLNQLCYRVPPIVPGDITVRRKNYVDVCHHAFSPDFILFLTKYETRIAVIVTYRPNYIPYG